MSQRISSGPAVGSIGCKKAGYRAATQPVSIRKKTCSKGRRSYRRPVKQVCEVLGVARSNVTANLARLLIGAMGEQPGKPMMLGWSKKSGASLRTCQAGVTAASGASFETRGRIKARLR